MNVKGNSKISSAAGSGDTKFMLHQDAVITLSNSGTIDLSNFNTVEFTGYVLDGTFPGVIELYDSSALVSPTTLTIYGSSQGEGRLFIDGDFAGALDWPLYGPTGNTEFTGEPKGQTFEWDDIGLKWRLVS